MGRELAQLTASSTLKLVNAINLQKTVLRYPISMHTYIQPFSQDYNYVLCSFLHNLYIHTYIIGHYNPSVRIIDLVSHNTYVVCVLILYISSGTYSLKSTPNDRFFEKLFVAIFYLLSEFLPEIC